MTAPREPIRIDWDLKKGKRLGSAAGSAAKAAADEPLVVRSDGKHAIRGVVRSKSNISNN